MMRTWRSVSLVLVSAFPPSPAPGPATLLGRGATVCHLAPAQGVLQALALSCSPFVTQKTPGPSHALNKVPFGVPSLRIVKSLVWASRGGEPKGTGRKEGDVVVET